MYEGGEQQWFPEQLLLVPQEKKNTCASVWQTQWKVAKKVNSLEPL